MKPVKAGKLNRRVTVEQNQADPANPADKDAFGQLAERWAPIFTAWASVEPVTAREYFAGVQMQADVTHKITVRYRPDKAFTGDMRIVLGTRVFHLTAPPRDAEDAHRVWECLAVEVVRSAANQ